MIRTLTVLILMVLISACAGAQQEQATTTPDAEPSSAEETEAAESVQETEVNTEPFGEPTPTPLPDPGMSFTANDSELLWEVISEDGAAIHVCPDEACDTVGEIASGVMVRPAGFNDTWLDLQPGEGRGGYLRVADTNPPD